MVDVDRSEMSLSWSVVVDRAVARELESASFFTGFEKKRFGWEAQMRPNAPTIFDWQTTNEKQKLSN